ncbi:MAG: hypothetical protein ABSB91_00255 [Sedimentisphaerales bacterium]
MQIQLELGPEFQKTLAELSGLGDAVSRACGIGLGKAVKFAANNVIKNYLTGQALKTRSGMLKKAVDGWPVSDTEAIVGVQPNSAVDKYAWLLGDEQKTITPVKGNALTIPIDEALTGAGVAKYQSVMQAKQMLGVDIFRLPGTNVLGYKVGKKGKFRALFILVKSVLVQGSGALADGVLESTDNMTSIIQEEIDKEMGNG